MTDKEKIDRMLAEYDSFKRSLEDWRVRRDALINDLTKRLEQSQVEDVLKRLKSL